MTEFQVKVKGETFISGSNEVHRLGGPTQNRKKI